jgi:hypothetical protein
LRLDWSHLYADAFHGHLFLGDPVEVPAVQPLYQNRGAEELHGGRVAEVPGLPPGSPDPQAWDATAYGLNSSLPNLQMRDWAPAGEYGLAVTTRAQHRRVCTMRIPGVQPNAAAYQALNRLTTAGSVVRMEVDGGPRDSWSGYATVALVNLSLQYARLPQWTVSLVSLSGRIPGRDAWILGATPLPAPVG